MKTTAYLLVGLTLGLVSTGYGAGDQFPAPNLTTAPKIDGVLSDGEWNLALKFEKLYDQATGKLTTERTESWIGVTEEGVYLAIYAHDSRPGEIVARTVQRGGSLDEDDFIGLIIDPMNRRDSNGNSEFFVNAIGTQFERIAGGRAAKKEWRGTWFSAVSRVDDGFIAEIMVPWKLLSYPGGRKGDVLFNIGRMHQRTKEVGFTADMGRPFRQENHPMMTGVEFPARSLADQIDLLGYFSPEYDEREDPSTSFRAGFDIRYKPTETLTSVLSMNPDFKNIEGQVEGIGFTRTERFLSDTRPFFTEGAQYFNLSSQHGIGRVFYSNRIDDFDQAFKFFGDFDKHQSLGFLVAREDGNRLDSVLRYGYRFGPRSTASAFMTYRDEPGSKNSVMGAKANFGSGNHDVGFELMQSDDDGQPGGAGYVYFDTSLPNYFITFTGTYIQPEFRPRLGFVSFVDRRGGFIYQEYEKEFREGWLRSVKMENFIEDFDHFDGSNFSRSLSFGAEIETRSDWAYGVDYRREVFEDEVSEQYSVGAGWNVSNRFKRLGVNYSWGDQNGVSTSFFSLNGQFRIGKGLDLGIQQSIFKLNGSREQSILSLGWEIDSEQSVTGRLVKRDSDTNWYLAYRKSGGLGLEYFLIFGDPNAREFRNRAAFKLVWAR